jgi:hypothetical protein
VALFGAEFYAESGNNIKNGKNLICKYPNIQKKTLTTRNSAPKWLHQKYFQQKFSASKTTLGPYFSDSLDSFIGS